MDAIVKIGTVWMKEDATGEPCDVCDEKIFSKTNILYIIVNENKKYECAQVCESCYYLIKSSPESEL